MLKIKNKIKDLVKKIFLNKRSAGLFIKPVLKMHSLSYALADRLAIELENGIHPKHRIIRYKEWFLNKIEPGWAIIDIGSNTGAMAVLLANKAKFVYAVESKKEFVEEAKVKRCRSNIEYIHADATKFDFAHCKQIDCIILSNVLEHIYDRNSFFKKLINTTDWNDLTQKRFLIRAPLIDRDWIVSYKKELGMDYRCDPSHFIEYTLESLKRELSYTGINIVNYDVKFGEIYACLLAPGKN
ncbi:MAG: class I SAM-dependent methyltransferase [Candidatus Omnitrophica bacterium]|nr:class I SAM-dependent methyltransferase [Candidatus Omnitrophota bacterium]